MKPNKTLLLTASAIAQALLSPAICSAQSILLTAEDFVLFAGTEVTVAGAGPNTFSNGDVGALSDISGFPPATVVNGMTILGGAIALQARDDIITARNALNALVAPPANNLTGVNGGDLATQTLTPGVYKFDVAASLSLNGVLTLDAQGQNNVTWVFNIGTSLTTGANAEIQFINLGTNGGSDNGLFWNAGSAITFGATNIIAGNYLALNDITFGTTVPATGSGSGRALSQTAAVTFDGTGTMDKLGAPGNGDMTGGLTIVGGNAVTSGYVLLSADGTYTKGLSNVVLKKGVIYNTPNVIVDGDSADTNLVPATLTVFQTIATLTGTNTYTGGTFIDAGELTASAANLPTNGAINFIDSNTTGTVGKLTFDQSVNGSFGGLISGNGSLTKEDAGSLTLTGINTYTGGTVIDGGTVIASTLILPENQDIALGVNGTLVLDETIDGTLGGAVTGEGMIEKQGVGALTLANSTNAEFDILAGSFILGNGKSVGATTVGANGFFGGSGTINGNFTNNGILSPGFSPGTIVIVGNYAQGPGGTLVIEIASPVSFDQLNITGTASLDGTLQIDTLGGYDPVGESFTFLTAAGGVNGAFAPITGSAAVDAVVTYNANDAVISFTQIPFNTFAGTPNQVAVSEAAQLSPELTTALNAVPLASEMPAALNALSPQGYEVWSDIAFAHTSSLANRLEHQPMAIPGRDNFYFEVSQSRSKTRGDLDIGSTHYVSEAALVGGNYSIAPNLTIGGFFEFTESDSGLGSFGSHTNVKDKMPGIRLAWEQDAWFASTSVGYGFDEYKSTRAINFPGTSEIATSRTSGNQWFADIRGGRDFNMGMVSLTPFAGIQVSGWNTDGFTETGAGDFNATVGSQSARSLRSQLGIRSALNFTVGTVMLSPHVSATWVHELDNDARSIKGAFGNLDYTVETRDPQEDSVRLGAGIAAGLTNGLTFYANYSAASGSTNRTIGEWRAGLSIDF
jgi:outer membrane autotransporter protein